MKQHTLAPKAKRNLCYISANTIILYKNIILIERGKFYRKLKNIESSLIIMYT